MKVVDLHPEELLEKDARGELTDAERVRLDAHLDRCSTCRFERQLRADFADDLADDNKQLSAAELVALVEGNVVKPAPTVEKAVEEEDDAPIPTPRRSTRPRRGARVWLLVAAALLVGGVAGAGVGVRTLSRMIGTPVEATVPTRNAADDAPPQQSLITPAKKVVAPLPRERSDRESSIENVVEEVTPVAPVVAPVPSHAIVPVLVVHPVEALAPPPPSPPVNTIPKTDVPDTAASLFDNAGDARRRGDHAMAILLYRRLEASFPQSRESHVSFATLGQLLLDRGDARGALQSFDAYQAKGPGALDEAVMVGRAKSLERLGRDADARAAWKALLAAFPGSPYARLAEARVAGAAP